ncbi:MAG: hypothetical protein PHE32_01355 [Candidatus Shapirobacteria bacterium]|nr:hypothetical protein [Candidatus Shapirobacteria bacterium]MDD4410336.1 hypothetical protein [Candidatus Shapirobacteria bacterium]
MRSKDKASWIIKLPAKAKILVEVGDKVSEGDKLAVFSSHKIETFDYSGPLSKMNENKREELNNFIKEKQVTSGDIFYDLGIFKNKICFPLTGLCLGLDEFKNLRIEKVENEKKEIFAPVEAKISKIEEGKMVLEFKAKEYKGEGLNQLKAWGEGEIKIIDEIKLLNFELNNNVLFTKNLDKAFLLKAQVVGVRAIVISDNNEIKEVNINLPVLRMEKENWNEFMKENLGKNKKMLVNSKMNKLLLMLE